MSREIKFRMWDGKLMHYPEDNYAYGLHWYRSGGWTLWWKWLSGSVFEEKQVWAELDNNKCPMMQFTGLKDKNGKEIYFGDILATSNSDPEFDIWGKEYYGYTMCVEKKDELGVSFTKWTPDPIGEESTYSLSFCEVIGNIYENKELLK